MTVASAQEIADARRILKVLSVPDVALQDDERFVAWVFSPKEAAETSEILARGMEQDDLLSPADRLTLAHFIVNHAQDARDFAALVSAAKLTILLSAAIGKYVSCAAHTRQLANAFMTDTPGLLSWIQHAAARNSAHLPDDESTQGMCAHATEQLAARYPS